MNGETAIATASIPGMGGAGYLEFEKPLQAIERQIEELSRDAQATGVDRSADIRQQRAQYRTLLKRLYGNLTPWETVLVARHPKRPLATDYLRLIFRDFCELHGDRTFGDDKAMITGFARLRGHRLMFIGHNKGKDVKERIACNFGCAHPEGYRKALQKMRLAEKYGLPVVCLIDTQGAYPGIGAEERGIAQAIAMNLMYMARLRTPVVCVVIGEGGSGGALGIGVGDRVAMLQHSFYSVISPEGCAAILWKTAEQRQHAAEALRLTSRDLIRLGIIDEIIPEPLGGAHREPERTAASLETFLVAALNDLKRLTVPALLSARQQRIRQIGACFESAGEILAQAAKEIRTVRRTPTRAARLRARLAMSEKVTS